MFGLKTLYLIKKKIPEQFKVSQKKSNMCVYTQQIKKKNHSS